MSKTIYRREQLEQQLSESRREFRAADATIHNLELKLADMAAQLANANSKCAALAAENAAIHETIEAVRSVADNSSGIAGWHLNGDIATWEEILPEINDIETTATNAFLTEVRAIAVEGAVGTIMVHMNHQHVAVAEALHILRTHAAQLRQEAAQ